MTQSPPALPDTFEWTRASWGDALRCAPLARVAPHVFTTRQLELSSAGEVDRLRDALDARHIVLLTQVHGAHVVVVRRGAPLPDGHPEADVLVSNAPDVALVVRAADCVPLLIADPVTGAVAAVHAGWRGTAARAAGAAVRALATEFGCRPGDLHAAIGPAIGRCCYEVGPELVDAFAEAGHERTHIERWFSSPAPPRGSRQRQGLFLDVAGANRDQLILSGLREDRIYAAGLCTAMHLDLLTSYRMEKEKAGRLAGAIRASA